MPDPLITNFLCYQYPSKLVYSKATTEHYGIANVFDTVFSNPDIFIQVPIGNGSTQDPSVPISGPYGWVQYCGFRYSFDNENWSTWSDWHQNQYKYDLKDPIPDGRFGYGINEFFPGPIQPDLTLAELFGYAESELTLGNAPYDAYNATQEAITVQGLLQWCFPLQKITLPPGEGLKTIYCQLYNSTNRDLPSFDPPGFSYLDPIDPARISSISWKTQVLLIQSPVTVIVVINDGVETTLNPLIKLTITITAYEDYPIRTVIDLSNDGIIWNRRVEVFAGANSPYSCYWDCSSTNDPSLTTNTKTVYVRVTDPGGTTAIVQSSITLVLPSICINSQDGVVGMFPSPTSALDHVTRFIASISPAGSDTSMLFCQDIFGYPVVSVILPVISGIPLPDSLRRSSLSQPKFAAAYRLSYDCGVTWQPWQPCRLTDYYPHTNMYSIITYCTLPTSIPDGPFNIWCNFADRFDSQLKPIDSSLDIGVVSDCYYTARTVSNTSPILLTNKPTVTVTMRDRGDYDRVVSVHVEPCIYENLDNYFSIQMSNDRINWGSPWEGLVDLNEVTFDKWGYPYTVVELTDTRYSILRNWLDVPVMIYDFLDTDPRYYFSWDCGDRYASPGVTKTVYLRIADRAGNISDIWQQTITYIAPVPALTTYVKSSPLALSSMIKGKRGLDFICNRNLLISQNKSTQEGLWVSSLTKGTNSYPYNRACVTSLRMGIASSTVVASTTEIQVKQLLTGTVFTRLTSTDPQYYTGSLLQRLGLPSQTLEGAIMAFLGSYVNRTLAAVSVVQVNRNDAFAVTELLANQDPGINPIVLPDDIQPVALVQGVYSRITSSSLVVMVSGDSITQYLWSLDNGVESTPVNTDVYIQLEGLLEGEHTLVVRGGTATGVWQTTPTSVTFTVDLDKPISFDPYNIPQGFIGMHTDVGSGSSRTRRIALSVNPYQVTNYSLDMQLASGTFSYSGLLTTVPLVKSVVSLQGINGTVQRVGPSASRSQPGYSVEGRLLPLFTSEFVYLYYPNRYKNMPYFVQDILDEVCSQAGTTVRFTASNNRLQSFEFSGRFTDALTQLADLACGELIQQNGKWFITPKGTVLGSFTVSTEDLISISQVDQVDLFDQVYSLFQSRRDTVVDLAKLQLTLNNTNGSSLAQAYRPLTNAKFSFGKKGKENFSPIPSGIMIENADTSLWESWTGNTPPNSNYFYTQDGTTPGTMQGLIGTTSGTSDNLTSTTNGGRYLFGVDLLYKVNLPADASGEYRAKGTLNNITAPFWSGSADTWDVLTPELRTTMVSTHNGASGELVKELYFKFSTMAQADPTWQDTQFWNCDLTIEYLPNSSAASASDNNRQNDLTDKLLCLDKEITRLGYGGLIPQLNIANLAWAQYYVRVGQKALLPELDSLNLAAVAADRLVVSHLVSLNPKAKLINIGLLYNGVMPLPANAIMLSGSVPNSGITTDCGRVEQVSFNGYQVSITARKV